VPRGTGGAGGEHRRPAGDQPAVECPLGGDAVRHGAFLAALAEDPHHTPLAVDVVDVEAAELTDPDAGGVEQLQDGRVACTERGAVVRHGRGVLQQRARLGDVERGRQRLVGLR
jgi:hypothetical protein